MKEVIHFAHGNGFPSRYYQQLFTHLQESVDLCYIDQVGHAREYPVTDNWPCLVDEVINSVRTQASVPVIAVGHSLGGLLSWLAAIERPDLFKGVILLDSPLMGRFKSGLIRLSKAVGVIDRITPAFRTRGRQQHWPTQEKALQYLKSRALFKTFTEACLQDYIDHGMEKSEEGYSLRFDRQVEYQIYRTIPHILHEYEGRMTVPSSLIYGDQSQVVEHMDVHYMQQQHGMATYKIHGTHMFPMEDPAAVAGVILKIIEVYLVHSPI